MLEFGFEVRRVLRRRNEAVGQNAIRAHFVERLADRLLADAGELHAPKVAQKRERAELFLGDQAFERVLLVRAAREADFPRIGSFELAVDELLPDFFLASVFRLGVGDEQHVAQAYGAVTIVFRELVGVELGERTREALLGLRRERGFLALLHRPERVGPVNGEEFGQFVGTLNDALKRVGHETAMGFVARHLAHEQKRRVTQLHVFARRDRHRRYGFGFHLRHERSNAFGD